jgi:hypothetical protein
MPPSSVAAAIAKMKKNASIAAETAPAALLINDSLHAGEWILKGADRI